MGRMRCIGKGLGLRLLLVTGLKLGITVGHPGVPETTRDKEGRLVMKGHGGRFAF